VIVGARCAGATLALTLAKRGWDVTFVDRDTFPSDTVSTHMIYPNTLARFEQLGILDTLRAEHQLPSLEWRVIGLGHVNAGLFTPIDGFDHSSSLRRVVLDEAIVKTALAAGAVGRFDERVVDLIGSGTGEDPVSGVVLESGERIQARWVFGADGRGSTVAGRLGIEKERRQQGEISFLFGYWAGVPDDGYGTLDIQGEHILSRWAVEDGLHLLVVAGDAEMTRGDRRERTRRYLEGLRHFPETLPGDQLDRGEMISEVVVAPESLMRGFFRKPTGPGWALLGDSAHFKHPGTAQGICDAVEQAIYITDHLSGAEPSLDGYAEWIDRRAKEHYDWSFSWGRFPRPESENLFRGWASEADAAQDLRDSFSRQVEPSQVMSPERLARWFSDAPARSA